MSTEAPLPWNVERVKDDFENNWIGGTWTAQALPILFDEIDRVREERDLWEKRCNENSEIIERLLTSLTRVTRMCARPAGVCVDGKYYETT